jgi:hypothetical protein
MLKISTTIKKNKKWGCNGPMKKTFGSVVG